jgi:aldehyde dehydrogenase (NAD+)
MSIKNPHPQITRIFSELGLDISACSGTFGQGNLASKGEPIESFSPIDGSSLGSVLSTISEQYEDVINKAQEAFASWRLVPSPKRGEVVYEIGQALRKHKHTLGELVSLEMGKIRAEGAGEIQEAIDIADFALGLSRQLYGKTMDSERVGHRLVEQWHPLGIVGVITAFNFPAAVWAWNAMVAAVCGNVMVWKPSELTPFTSIAMNALCSRVAAEMGYPGLFSLISTIDARGGKWIASDKRIPLVSATGSCEMGRSVAEVVGRRLGRSLLELGGNNAIIVMDDADLDLVIPAVVFGAVGTAGQRCTTTRRLLLQKAIAPAVKEKLLAAYKQVRIGDPLSPETLMGPLIHERSVRSYEQAMERVRREGGNILFGGEKKLGMPSDFYVQPTLVDATADMLIVREETFAPILYILEFETLAEAIAIQNDVPQGLSSSIFTTNMRSAEWFLSHGGSDCGIANVNIGTSGAEIGGAFGGEKDTGGGRESGSDAWRQYMRCQTNTINYSRELPLAQGIEFNL